MWSLHHLHLVYQVQVMEKMPQEKQLLLYVRHFCDFPHPATMLWFGRFKTQNYSDRKEMMKNMPEITGYSVGASPCDPPSHFSSSPLVWFNISTTKTLKSINWEGCKSVFSGLNNPWVLKVNRDDPHGFMAEIVFMRPQLLFNSCSLMLRGKEKATVKKH